MSDDNKHKQDNATVEAVAENQLLLAVKSGNRVDIANTYISELHENKSDDKKKKRQNDIADLLLKQLLDELSEIASDIGDLVDKRKENTDKLKQATKIMKDWDMQEAQLFLMNQGEDVKGMDENDLVDAMRRKIKTLIQNDKSLGQQIANKVQQAQNKMNGKDIDPELTKEISDMMQQAEDTGVDADKAILEADRITEFSNEAIIEGDNKFIANERSNALSSSALPENDPFAEIAEVSTSTANDVAPFAELAEEKSITTSFSKSVGDPPFAEKAITITDPFNEVATKLKIEPKNEIDLNVKPEEPVIKSDIGLG